MTWVAVGFGGAALIGGAISAYGANSAANTQAGAAENAQAISGNEFNTITQQESPYMQAGYGSLGSLESLLGISPLSQGQAGVSGGGINNVNGFNGQSGLPIGSTYNPSGSYQTAPLSSVASYTGPPATGLGAGALVGGTPNSPAQQAALAAQFNQPGGQGLANFFNYIGNAQGSIGGAGQTVPTFGGAGLAPTGTMAVPSQGGSGMSTTQNIVPQGAQWSPQASGASGGQLQPQAGLGQPYTSQALGAPNSTSPYGGQSFSAAQTPYGSQSLSAPNTTGFGSLNTPFTSQGAYQANQGIAPQQSYQAMAPFTAQTFQQYSPAYNFQLQQGQQGVLNGDESSQGALSGAALKDLTSYNQNFANTAFNNAYNQYQNQYQTNFSDYQGAYTNAFNQNQTQYQNNFNNYQDAYSNAFNQYQTQQNNVYGRLSSVAQLGQNAAANTGQQGTQLAGQQAQSATNVGTALAAGQVGVANAASGAVGTLGVLPYLAGSSGSNASALSTQQPAVIQAENASIQ